jgi:membrane-associated phospholipid phosphatase
MLIRLTTFQTLYRTWSPQRGRTLPSASTLLAGLLLFFPCFAAHAQGPALNATAGTMEPAGLPDAPSTTLEAPSRGFTEGWSGAVKTIGSDEWHFLKYPFQKKAIVWDVLFLGATGVLIANDESVLHQVPTSWHNTSITASNTAMGAAGATAGGIYLTGLITHNDHAEQTGIRTAEATIDSMIMYGAAKAIFARERPFTGPDNEGKFFSGNWSNGSFPSGHAMFTWTVASTVAHEYHAPWVKFLMYGMAATVSTTRVTARQHFPSDVFVGSVVGYGIGSYVARKDKYRGVNGHPYSRNRLQRMQAAVLGHVTIQ